MQQRFQSFVTGITNCHKCIQRIKAAEMTELGLKGTHVMCLFFLYHHAEGLTASRLCELCAEDKAAISRSINALQKQGYIAPTDGKYRALLRLTPEGRQMAFRVEELIGQWVEWGGAGLAAEERAVFYRALEHIARNLQERMETNQNRIKL